MRGAAITRRNLLVGIGAAPLAVASAAAAAPRSDLELLERLLRLERRLEATYEAAYDRSILGDELARSLRDQERAHVDGLEKTLSARGRRPGPAPGGDPRLATALRERRTFARYALEQSSHRNKVRPLDIIIEAIEDYFQRHGLQGPVRAKPKAG